MAYPGYGQQKRLLKNRPSIRALLPFECQDGEPRSYIHIFWECAVKTNTIPYINSAEALGQYTKQAGVSVILAGSSDQSSLLNSFPQALAKEIVASAPEVRLALASPSILMAYADERAGFRQVAYHDGFIFADGQLCWRSESPFPTDPKALLAEAVTYFVNSMFEQGDYHLKRKHSDLLNQVKLVTLQRLVNKKSNKKSKAVPPKPPQDEDPYKTLGLSPGSTWDQVRKTRNELLIQYHPDKVAAMGPKLREVAEAETEKINAAFDQLERKLRPSKRK